ncbi:beta/gamma crystallin-related protein [Rhodoferax sp.]|uniref:beta/gamma crystallin-related protein n=1 Tax=Rhodoferax sp. TaxID=50421 RepID=UPI00284F2FB8|nr:beta/gamma crystallin-related protein [Rhodoferax sp.]MDR3368382.1 beta/gamma crystallin-related protein [Rhodoferax sp.]
MHALIRNLFAIAGVAIAAQAVAQVTFYERENFGGQSFSTQRQIGDFSRYGFNDRASSAEVTTGRWEVCEDSRFHGHCVILREGRYPSLVTMGLNDRVSSVRLVSRDARIDDQRYAPAPPPEPVRAPDFRRRNNERLFEARVTSVHAVVGPPEHRCWVEREQVAPEQRNSNVPGAVVGALIGGVLGHQVGGGAGKDLATVGGAVAGAAIGNQVGRNNEPQSAQTQDVQRCRDIPSQARPEFWDVTYNFRGLDHQVQLTAPPGPSVTVNQRGEPRE